MKVIVAVGTLYVGKEQIGPGGTADIKDKAEGARLIERGFCTAIDAQASPAKPEVTVSVGALAPTIAAPAASAEAEAKTAVDAAEEADARAKAEAEAASKGGMLPLE